MTAIEARADLANAPAVVHKLVQWLETTEVPDGLFADDLFTDFTMPIWRLQAGDRAGGLALRAHGRRRTKLQAVGALRQAGDPAAAPC